MTFVNRVCNHRTVMETIDKKLSATVPATRSHKVAGWRWILLFRNMTDYYTNKDIEDAFEAAVGETIICSDETWEKIKALTDDMRDTHRILGRGNH